LPFGKRIATETPYVTPPFEELAEVGPEHVIEYRKSVSHQSQRTMLLPRKIAELRSSEQRASSQ